jgi:sarcosine dehydrogenase
MAWPFEEHHSGRPRRVSPLYGRLLQQGAVFGEKLGWERPNWFADASRGETPHDEYTYERQNWFAAVGREHRACREAAVLVDQTSFAKFALKGPDALAALDWICANDIDKPVGSLTYTQMLDDSGGIQCDLTVCRVGTDEFYIVTGTGFATHDFDWIQRNIPPGSNAQLFDITSGWAVLSLMGPNSRTILQSVTRTDISDQAFPFGTIQTIGVAGCPVRALRVTYMGELGWELHLPVEYATAVYDTVIAAGTPHGLVNAGYRAIESCRLEKGYRAWGADIGPDHTPLEAGLGWAVKLRTDTQFKGRPAIEAQRTSGVRKLLAAFTVDPSIVLLGRETIYRDGQRVGWLTSAGFGYTIDRSIGYGYVRNPDGVTADWVGDASYELEVATDRVAAEISLRPLYDPTNARIKT